MNILELGCLAQKKNNNGYFTNIPDAQPLRVKLDVQYCSCGGLVGETSLIEARGERRFIVEVRDGALSPLR